VARQSTRALIPALPGRDREWALLAQGARFVAGVDEAGRGALAGPVVAAAVILPPNQCPDGVDDSKKLLPAVREELFAAILEAAAGVSVHVVGPRRIDSLNILRASHEALRKAAEGLAITPCVALVDGLPVPSYPCPHEAIIGGDGRECCIAAASIVAKVTRDRLMADYAAYYPEYGFQHHKGYATAAHRTAIIIHGPALIHRRSFLSNLIQWQRSLQGELEL